MAVDCDFPGNDFRNVSLNRIDCGKKCSNTSGCTHFTWTNWNGGTCWMKKGLASKLKAVELKGAVCGVVRVINFYVIAHMVNNQKLIDLALRNGANSIEIDVKFDTNTGNPTDFEHGSPCDCCSNTSSSFCTRDKSCGGSTNIVVLLNYIATRYPNLPLIYFDSKASGLKTDVQKLQVKRL